MQMLAKALNTSESMLSKQQSLSKMRFFGNLSVDMPYEEAWAMVISPQAKLINRYSFTNVELMPRFSFANNLCNLATFFMMAVGNTVLAPLSDRCGRKPVMQLSLVGTIISYAAIWFVVKYADSFWLFLTFTGINGFFSSIGQTFFADIYEEEPEKARPWIGIALFINVLGAALGAIFLVPFTQPPPGNDGINVRQMAFSPHPAVSHLSLVLRQKTTSAPHLLRRYAGLQLEAPRSRCCC